MLADSIYYETTMGAFLPAGNKVYLFGRTRVDSQTTSTLYLHTISPDTVKVNELIYELPPPAPSPANNWKGLIQSRISSVKHSNGKDWWVFTFHNRDTLYVWHVSESGVRLHHKEKLLGNPGFNPYAGLNWNANGSQVVLTCGWSDIRLYDFNRCTGSLGRQRLTLTNMNQQGIIDCVFSPNGKYIYYANGIFRRYDIAQGTIDSIGITTFFNLAPNGRLYGVNEDSSFCIFYPDSANYVFQSPIFDLGVEDTICLADPNMPNYRMPALTDLVPEFGVDTVLVLPGDTLHLGWAALPPDSGHTYHWFAPSGWISDTTQSQIILEVPPGTPLGVYPVYFTVYDTTNHDTIGCNYNRDSLFVSVGVSALHEQHISSEIRLYPNPASTEITISHSPEFVGTLLEIQTTQGIAVQSVILQSTPTRLSIEKLPAGIYVIKAGTFSSKLVIQR